MKTVITKEQIAARNREIAREISEKYANKPLTLIGVLRGGAPFLVDLMRELNPDIDVEIDFISVGSYGNNTESSGVVQLHKDVTSHIGNRYVVLVDDIVDTGHTLKMLRELFAHRTLGCECACMLSKPARREVEVEVEYIGFEIPNKYVIGYGLDAAQKYRNLPDIRFMDD